MIERFAVAIAWLCVQFIVLGVYGCVKAVSPLTHLLRRAPYWYWVLSSGLLFHFLFP